MPQLERREYLRYNAITSDQALDGRLHHARYHQLVGRLSAKPRLWYDIQTSQRLFIAFKWHTMMRGILKAKMNKRTKLPVGKEKRYAQAMRAIHMGGLEHPCVALKASNILKEDRRRNPIFLPRDDGTIPKRGLRRNAYGDLPVLFYYQRKNPSFPRLKTKAAAVSTAERLDRKMPNITLRQVLFQYVQIEAIAQEATEHVNRKYTKMVCVSTLALANRNFPLCLTKYVLFFAFGREDNEARAPFKGELIYELISKLYNMSTKKRPYTSLASSIEMIEKKDMVIRANARADKTLAEANNFDSIRSVRDLDALSVDKLKVLCRVRKIVGYSKLRRAELVAHIQKCLSLGSDHERSDLAKM